MTPYILLFSEFFLEQLDDYKPRTLTRINAKLQLLKQNPFRNHKNPPKASDPTLKCGVQQNA